MFLYLSLEKTVSWLFPVSKMLLLAILNLPLLLFLYLKRLLFAVFFYCWIFFRWSLKWCLFWLIFLIFKLPLGCFLFNFYFKMLFVDFLILCYDLFEIRICNCERKSTVGWWLITCYYLVPAGDYGGRGGWLHLLGAGPLQAVQALWAQVPVGLVFNPCIFIVGGYGLWEPKRRQIFFPNLNRLGSSSGSAFSKRLD